MGRRRAHKTGLFYSIPSSPITGQLIKFNVKYNNTDYGSYLTTNPVDGAAIPAAAKVISVATVTDNGTGNSNYVIGVAYMYDDVHGDRIAVFQNTNSEIMVFPANNVVQAAKIYGVLLPSKQCIAFDPINQYFHIYNSANNTIKVYNTSNTLITTYNTSGFSDNGPVLYYDYTNPGTWYASVAAVVAPIERWTLSGSTVTKAETKWYSGDRAVCLSDVYPGQIIVQDGYLNAAGTGVASDAFRWQTLDGLSSIYMTVAPITQFTGGVLEYPDGTLGNPNPSGYGPHGGTPNGNSYLHTDPKGNYLKYDRSPNMTRFSKFKGGSLSGNYGSQIITHNSTILSPVYDFGANTYQQNLSAWEAVVGSGTIASLEFRGSNSAPSTSSTTNMFSNVPTYDSNQSNEGWGTTTPGSYQAGPTAHRYMQCRISISLAAPSTTITVAALIAGLGANLKILTLEYKDQYIYHNAGSTSPLAEAVTVLTNQAVPSNYFLGGGSANNFSYNSGGLYTSDQSNSANMLLKTPSAITSDTQGQLTVVSRRESTLLLSVPLAAGTSGSTHNRLVFRHNASNIVPNSEICIEEWDNAGAVVNRVGIVDTSTSFERVDFICDGSQKYIWIGGVNQTLDVSVGSNNGRWFSALSPAPNIVYKGFSSGINGQGRLRMTIYSSAPFTSIQNALIDSFISQEGLLA